MEGIQSAPSSVPYQLGDLLGEQHNETALDDLDDTLTNWVPLRHWFMDEKIIDPELSKAAAFDRFIKILRTGSARSRRANGHWCIAEFGGAQTIKRKRDTFATNISNHLC